MDHLSISSSAQMDALLERSKVSEKKPSPNEVALKKACNDFETVLTTQILKSGMKNAEGIGGKEEEDGDKGSESFREIAYEQLAGFIGKQGTLGLGNMLFNTLKTRLKDTGGSK